MNTNAFLDRLSELVGTVYEGPLDDPPWQRQLAALREAMDAKDAYLILRQPSAEGMGISFHVGSTRSAEPEAPYYAQGLYALDPFVNLPPNQPVLLSEFVGNAALHDNEFFRLAMAPLDIFHVLGVDLLDPAAGLRANLRFTRGQAQPDFGAADTELCALLTPHFCRALRTHSRLREMEAEQRVYAGAMTQLAVATILLDEQRRVLRTNPLAERLLQEHDALRLVDDRLQLTEPHSNARMRQLIAEVVEAQRKGVATLARAMQIDCGADQPPLSLVVRPAPAGAYPEGANAPAITLFLSDPNQQPESSAKLLAELFGLTPTEARLSILLANGATVETASGELNISQYTARAHLRAIFSKTGVTRQSQLVSLVLNSVISLG